MKTIPLTQGQVALVDDEDFVWLSQWKWRIYKSRGFMYAGRSVNCSDGHGHIVPMHRQIMGLGYGDPRQIDHIHHRTLDNRRSELRIVTNQQNAFNRRNPKGFYFDKIAERYHSTICVCGKTKYLGLHETPELAHAAYLKAKEQYHVI